MKMLMYRSAVEKEKQPSPPPRGRHEDRCKRADKLCPHALWGGASPCAVAGACLDVTDNPEW